MFCYFIFLCLFIFLFVIICYSLFSAFINIFIIFICFHFFSITVGDWKLKWNICPLHCYVFWINNNTAVLSLVWRKEFKTIKNVENLLWILCLIKHLIFAPNKAMLQTTSDQIFLSSIFSCFSRVIFSIKFIIKLIKSRIDMGRVCSQNGGRYEWFQHFNR